MSSSSCAARRRALRPWRFRPRTYWASARSSAEAYGDADDVSGATAEDRAEIPSRVEEAQKDAFEEGGPCGHLTLS